MSQIDSKNHMQCKNSKQRFLQRLNMHFWVLALNFILIGFYTGSLQGETGNPPVPLNPFENIPPEQAPQGDKFISEFIHMLTVLGFIVGLILLVAWLLKRMLNTRIQQINTTSGIKIIESRSLSPKTTIYLLNIKGLNVAVAESHNGATLLGTLDKLDSDDEERDNTSDFQKLMQDKTKPTT